MNKRNDLEYYKARAVYERGLAGTSADISAARVHREMAERYEEMIGIGKFEAAATPATMAAS